MEFSDEVKENIYLVENLEDEIWVLKVKKSNYDANMLKSSKSKCDIGCLNHMTKDITFFSYYSYSGEVSSYSNNKGKIVWS